MSGKPGGNCQVCGGPVEAYSAPLTQPAVFNMTKRLPPPRPLTAEPCGHEQPEPVIFPAHTPTYPQT